VLFVKATRKAKKRIHQRNPNESVERKIKNGGVALERRSMSHEADKRTPGNHRGLRVYEDNPNSRILQRTINKNAV
jgi:hypothetical protein